MKTTSITSCVGVSVAALAMSCTVGAGLASAQPDLSPLINTACSYSQIVAALNAQAPALANALSQNPKIQNGLPKFLALPVNARQQVVQRGLAAHPKAQNGINQLADSPQFGATVSQIASSCHEC